MSAAHLSRLEEITDLSMILQGESNDFTEWLAKDENIRTLTDLLSEAAGLKFSAEKIKSKAENFSVIITASEAETNRKVIIMTDFDSTDDSGLGKLITSAAINNADLIIWIVRQADDEHRAAIEWLNSRKFGNIEFLLCKIKLFRIGNSEPAVKFEVISRSKTKKSDATDNVEKLRFEYWNAFQAYAFDGGNNPKFAASYRRWQTSSNYGVVFGTGKPGFSIIIAKTKDDIEAGLNIADDKKSFEYLLSRKNDIEAECGFNFDWIELTGRKGSRISTKKSPAKLDDKSSWPDQFEWIMTSILKIREVFGKYIRESENGK